MKAILIASLLFLLPVSVLAKPISLGVFDKDKYVYEDSTIVYEDNVRYVWIMTTAKKFNMNDDPDYVGAAGRFIIDCSGHASVFIEGLTVDKKGKTIQRGVVPHEKWIYAPIEEHTPQAAVFKALCVKHPIL